MLFALAGSFARLCKQSLKYQPDTARVTNKNSTFLVDVVVSNKPGARDPEGETIVRDLVKSDFAGVKSIRVGKFLRVQVEASGPAEAKALVKRLCDELRIYNPAAHSCSVSLERSSN